MIWTPRTRRAALVAMTCGATALPSVGGLAQQAAKGLRIVVIAGEDAVNIIQQRTAVAPLVEVRDRNDNPVAGALVTFSIQGGQNATFGGGLQSVIVTTNAAGRAAVTGFTPTASGAVQINVAATFQGQAATATITQTNVATAAQAAQAAQAGAGGSGGGLSTTMSVVVAGGAGAGAYVGLKSAGVIGGEDDPPPQIQSLSATPQSGLAGMSIAFNVGLSAHSSSGAPPDLTMVWDFGDGSTRTIPIVGFTPVPVTHAYSNAGTFVARLTITSEDNQSADAQTTVVVKSLTGRWTFGTTFYDFVQSGSAFTGTVSSATAVLRTLSGTVNTTSWPVTFTESNGTDFVGSPINADLVSGSLGGGPFLALTRQ